MRTFLSNPRGGPLRLGIACLLLLTFALGSLIRAGQNPTKLERPVMMDSNGPGSELFVLDSSGSLHEFHVLPNELQEFASFSLPSEFAPADMTYVSSDGQEFLLIAGTQSGRGVVVSYSLDGRPLKTWSFQNICSGIDFGSKSHSAYVATSDSNEIFRLDLQGTKPTYVTRIENAAKLGPLAFDETRHNIYVAGVAGGRIHLYSIASKTSKVLVGGLSAPTALSYDPDSNRLFIADPGRRGIFTVDTRSATPTAVEFAPNSLTAPYGMALVSDSRLAVADYGSNSIAVFSLKGALLFRFSSSN